MERSDVTAVPAASVVGEAMAAYVLAQAYLEKFSCDSHGRVKAAVRPVRERPGGAGVVAPFVALTGFMGSGKTSVGKGWRGSSAGSSWIWILSLLEKKAA